MIGLPTFGPYFVTSSTGGNNFTCIRILTPGLPGTSVLLSTVHLDQIHLYDLVVFVHHHNEQSHPLVVLLFFCWFTFANFSPVNGFLVVGVVIVFVPGSPFERLSLYLALSLDQIRVFIKRNFFR